MDELYIINQYQELVSQTNIVSKTDVNWIITYVNDNFCKISWYSKEELIWKPQNIVRHPSMPKKVFSNLWDTIKEKKKIWTWIIKNKKKNWDEYWVRTTISPIFDRNWNIIEFISVRTDITDLELTKNSLKKSLLELREIDKKKDDFLNISSHELRTPMTAIKWYLSMILEWDIWNIDEEAQKYLFKIYENVEVLLSLINDMLDITKIESWKIQFNDEKVEIYKIILKIIDKYWIKIKEKNIIFDVEIDENISLFVDRERITQVFDNLIENAIKFNINNWYIKIKSFDKWNQIHIIIKDTWLWIEKKDIENVFKKFWQINNYLTRDIWWTWLWLAISRAIVRNYKWDIKVVSEVWKGSEFIIILPKK